MAKVTHPEWTTITQRGQHAVQKGTLEIGGVDGCIGIHLFTHSRLVHVGKVHYGSIGPA